MRESSSPQPLSAPLDDITYILFIPRSFDDYTKPNMRRENCDKTTSAANSLMYQDYFDVVPFSGSRLFSRVPFSGSRLFNPVAFSISRLFSNGLSLSNRFFTTALSLRNRLFNAAPLVSSEGSNFAQTRYIKCPFSWVQGPATTESIIFAIVEIANT